jgi:hypothetical protein
MAWHQLRHAEEEAASKESIGEVYDPYCFVDLFDEPARPADSGVPCGGAGMDGF